MIIHNRYNFPAGTRFGQMTFIGLSESRGDNGRVLGEFRCDCGSIGIYPMGRMVGKYRDHCGCKTDRGKHRKHGMHGSPEYGSWEAMKGRCLRPSHKDFPRWGGVGVSIHPDWVESFEAFYKHMGPRPEGTTLDRIDNTKGYVPGNVRWATYRQQQRNRRTSYYWIIKGRIFQTADDAADYFGVSDVTIHRWVKGSFDARRQTFTPPRGDCYAHLRY